MYDVNDDVALKGGVRRIEVHEIAQRRTFQDSLESRLADSSRRVGQRPRNQTEVFAVADPRVRVAADRDVELSLRVQPEEPVESRAIEVDQFRRPVPACTEARPMRCH